MYVFSLILLLHLGAIMNIREMRCHENSIIIAILPIPGTTLVPIYKQRSFIHIEYKRSVYQGAWCMLILNLFCCRPHGCICYCHCHCYGHRCWTRSTSCARGLVRRQDLPGRRAQPTARGAAVPSVVVVLTPREGHPVVVTGTLWSRRSIFP